jgi:hypothetical protein
VLIILAGMNTRSIVIPIATGLLGFCLGTLTGPIDLRSRGSLERENGVPSGGLVRHLKKIHLG